MTIYMITSGASIDLGTFSGESDSEALLAILRDGGYTAAQVWLEDGVLCFAADDYREMCGGVEDYRIEQIAILPGGWEAASLSERIAFESAALSIGDELLPDFARSVRDGAEATAEYWSWLLDQWEKASSDR